MFVYFLFVWFFPVKCTIVYVQKHINVKKYGEKKARVQCYYYYIIHIIVTTTINIITNDYFLTLHYIFSVSLFRFVCECES